MAEIKAKKVIFKNRDGEHLIPYVGDSAIENRITNCLLEVPQRIKLELNNGVLTLKAGSEVIVPNGFEADGTTPKFDYVTIESDVTGFEWVGAATNQYFAFYATSSSVLDGTIATKVTSATSFPSSPTNGDRCYRTDLNEMYVYKTATSSWLKIDSFPIGLVSGSGTAGKMGSIDQVFNGMGYIGSTVWVDKGVKGLCPDEFNEDGTYKSIEINTTKLTTTTNPFGANPSPSSYMSLTIGGSVNVMHRYIESTTAPTTTYTTWYNPTTNKILYAGATAGAWVKQNAIPIASLNWTYVASPKTNTFTSLVPKQPFRAVDYNDLLQGNGIKTVVETYVNGTSWYRVWSDGWCEQGGVYASTTSNTFTTFLKPFKSVPTFISQFMGTTTESGCTGSSAEVTATQFRIRNGAHGGSHWSVYGNNHWVAQGYIS